MRFAVLGPVEVSRDGEVVPPGSGRERFVLTTLLLAAPAAVRADALIDALWPDDPPPTAKAQLHNLVSRLRGRLGPEVITSGTAGYELRIDGHQLDLHEFRSLAANGALDDALALWRGPALANVPDELAAGLRQALHGERLAVIETRLATELEAGRTEDVLRELRELIREHPYREELREQHMRALLKAGRRAEALEVYRRTHRVFADELGIKPGEGLRRLEQQALHGIAVRPRQLPAQVVPLVGRADLVQEVSAAHGVVLLLGPGGVGKSVLALTVAHRMSAKFPDGQLYADLRATPAAHEVLGRFLRALGAEPPADSAERVALYRSHLADRQVLVVLDDARDEEQVRPLLNGTTLITSRHRLGGLLGVRRWTLPLLSPASSAELLASVIGAQRVAAEREAATEIAELCGHLPLALSVAAGRLAIEETWRLEDLRARLTDERSRLGALRVGDVDVRASIELSCEALDPAARKLFHTLGNLSGPDWPAWVATPAVDALVDAHLVVRLGRDAAGQERYRMHELVLAFAREREEDVSAILTGWLALVSEADAQLDHDLPRPSPLRAVAPTTAARRHPLEWFDTEWPNLLAAVAQASDLELGDLATELLVRMAGYWWLRSLGDELEHLIPVNDDIRLIDVLFEIRLQRNEYAGLPALADRLLSAASTPEWEVRALRRRGQASMRQGLLGEAAAWHSRAVAAARTGCPDLVQTCLDSLAWTLTESGKPERAVTLFDPSATGALAHYHRGIALTDLNRIEDADRAFAKARKIADEGGETAGLAYLDQASADADIRAGRYAQAAFRLDAALGEHERNSCADGVGEVLRSQADLAIVTGREADAIRYLRRALTTWRSIGDDLQIARVLARLHHIGAAGDEHQAILARLCLPESCLRMPRM
ncbi:BTAD domain-containing putative transcriptional regulator [Lentzea sp. JNUCC 0626]|uniref:AfsR/SARP family transcriptional regulator n=1 Tax=Lentzea sp. JNUCC 0626 TaxID=3367513 RepID=UPI003748EAB8